MCNISHAQCTGLSVILKDGTFQDLLIFKNMRITMYQKDYNDVERLTHWPRMDPHFAKYIRASQIGMNVLNPAYGKLIELPDVYLYHISCIVKNPRFSSSIIVDIE